ncbi:hypothetical protein ACH5RR_026263 [Cinchona calisaya]|uniref:Uncharacterized protein n=1 Tax=Cinchona calisaya TaxID=153742 RepID=A0ABD2Z227_9GENT
MATTALHVLLNCDEVKPLLTMPLPGSQSPAFVPFSVPLPTNQSPIMPPPTSQLSLYGMQETFNYLVSGNMERPEQLGIKENNGGDPGVVATFLHTHKKKADKMGHRPWISQVGHDKHGAQEDEVQPNKDTTHTQEDIKGQEAQDDDDDDGIDATYNYITQQRDPILASQATLPHQDQDEVGHDSEATEDNVPLIWKVHSNKRKRERRSKGKMTHLRI